MDISTPKAAMLTRLRNVLKGQAMFLLEDQTINNIEKKEQMEVINQFVKFLDNYDINIQILNQKYIQDVDYEK